METLVESTGQQKTVRELIAELAALEDRIRVVQTFEEPSAPHASPFNPELVELAQQERRVVAALRQHRTRV